MGNRPKMDRAERAKQFMPFAALKGYEEALREREKQVQRAQQKQVSGQSDLPEERQPELYTAENQGNTGNKQGF